MNLLDQVASALEAAKAQLEYCNYGDAWEREGCEDLKKQIDEALESYKSKVVEKVVEKETFVCKCNRPFKTLQSLKQHRKNSLNCSVNKYHIKTCDDKYYISKSGYSLTSIKKERGIYSSISFAEHYIKGTNVFGPLKIVKEKS